MDKQTQNRKAQNRKNRKFNAKHALVDRFIDQIKRESEGAEFKKGWKRVILADSINPLPHNGAQGNAYRGMNLLFLGSYLASSGYIDPRFMTLKQAERKYFPSKDAAGDLKGYADSLESFAETLDLEQDDQGAEKARKAAEKARAMADYIENTDYKPGDKKLLELARDLAYASTGLTKHDFVEEDSGAQAKAIDTQIKKHTGVLKKGASSTIVMVPIVVEAEATVTEEANATGEDFVNEVIKANQDQGEDQSNEGGEQNEQKQGKRIRRAVGKVVGVKALSIYHISNFQNLPEGYMPIDDNPRVFGGDALTKDDDVAIVNMIVDRAKEMGLEVERGGSEAFYNVGTNNVRIPLPERFENMAEAAHTLLHELAHATKASNVGLERSFMQKLDELKEKHEIPEGIYDKMRYAFEEGVAELSAINMCRLGTLPFDQKGAHAYLKGWLVEANHLLTGLRLDGNDPDARDEATGLSVKDLKDLTYRMIEDASKAVDTIMQPGAENGLFQRIMAARDNQIKAHAEQVVEQAPASNHSDQVVQALEKTVSQASEEPSDPVITETDGALLDRELDRIMGIESPDAAASESGQSKSAGIF